MPTVTRAHDEARKLKLALSIPVPTVDEFLALPFVNGHTIKDVFPSATFYASTPGVKQP